MYCNICIYVHIISNVIGSFQLLMFGFPADRQIDKINSPMLCLIVFYLTERTERRNKEEKKKYKKIYTFADGKTTVVDRL